MSDMPDLTVEAETHALLCGLEGASIGDGVIRAHAMMAAAVSFLARITGHGVVAAQLRADADTVASFAPPTEGLSLFSTAGLH